MLNTIVRTMLTLLPWLAAAPVVAGSPEQPASDYLAVPNRIFLGDFEEHCKAIPGRSRAATVAGACWILSTHPSPFDRSCQDVCGEHGRVYSELTRTFAGSDGTNAACSQVLTGLLGMPIPVLSDPEHFHGVLGLGCGRASNAPLAGLRVRVLTHPGAQHEIYQRACACAPKPKPSLRYLPYNRLLYVDRPVAITPTATGVSGSYQIEPGPPQGLSLDSINGMISGTPLVVQPNTTYQVSALTAAGPISTQVSIEIAVLPLHYPGGFRFVEVGAAMTPWVPTMNVALTGFAATPTLPAGLSLHASTGVISGTPVEIPTQPQPQRYTITAASAGGTVSTEIYIGVVSSLPPCVTHGGVQVAGVCWYRSQINESCAQACAALGGYHPATATYAGSGGSDGNCTQVLRALFNPFLPTAIGTPSLHGAGNLGCGIDMGLTGNPYRLTSATSANASAWFFQRACACNQ